ncbi:MAG TPA: DUF423 domain-containing protein [Ferruginibacter sp.]|jgi:uncharacterized membrane protein YgdD (TMEM256/DUF423 family)|nr:DUF423 domain-containing protein [Ferruginibacter sp.]
MHKGAIKAGAILAALSIVLGAFGAHALKEILDAEQLQVFDTAVRYQMYHALALLIVGILHKEFFNKQIDLAGVFFIAGILLFSGSLYTICYLQYQQTAIPALIGIMTPLGGICFIIGWILLLIGVAKKV